MKLNEKDCLCPYCGDKLLKSECETCSHKDFVFEDVCFCPHCESYFIHSEPLFSRTAPDQESETVIFPQWQGQKKRFYQ